MLSGLFWSCQRESPLRHFSAAAAENNYESDEDYPDIVVVEKIAKAVVHSEPPYVFIERFPLSIIYYDG